MSEPVKPPTAAAGAAPVAAAAPLAAASPTAAAPSAPSAPAPSPAERLFTAIRSRFAVERDPADRWGVTVIAASGQLRDLLRFLRDTHGLVMLLDVAGVDYLAYPNHRAERFAVVYLLKGLSAGLRCSVKVRVDEERPELPSVHDLFKSADWAERECFDQVGIVFTGHPNLKRLLNHHEFVGHPLRKDYPCQKRQKLTVNDPMIDQLTLRLRQLGHTVLDEGDVHAPAALAPAAVKAAP